MFSHRSNSRSTSSLGLSQRLRVSSLHNDRGARLSTDTAVRADRVAYGRKLAADPHYPSRELMHEVARLVVASMAV
jgi:hypothetical protein